MVLTRSSGRVRAERDEESSSQGESDIPAQTVRRRAPQTGTPPTLRPSKQTTGRGSSAAKRKRDDTVSNARPGKRQKESTGIKDSIEVGGETGYETGGETGDETHLNGTLFDILRQPTRKPTSNIVVDIPSSRRLRENHDAATTTNVASETRTGPVRARRMKRGINSIEVLGTIDGPRSPRTRRGEDGLHTIRETPQPQSRPQPAQEKSHLTEAEEEAVGSGNGSLEQLLGSPELQSSALKRRPAKPPADVYDFPDGDSEPPTPHATLQRTTRNNSRLANRANVTKKSGRKPPLSRKRLSSIQEEQPQPTSPPPPRPDARQSVANVTNRRALEDATVPSEVGETEFEELDEQEETEESDEASSESDEGANAAPRGPASQGAVAIHVQPYAQSQRSMTVISDHINSMLSVMGRAGWTGAGERWDADLLRDSMLEVGGEAPALTRLGRGCYKSLINLKEKLDKVPDALDLQKQSGFLTKEEQALNKAMASVDQVVTKIFNDALAIPSNPGAQSNTTRNFREAVVKDLLSCLIPMLVLVLRSSFVIGTAGYNTQNRDPLPQEGVFTGATVQYMLTVTSWLLRLEKPLRWALSQRSRETGTPNPAAQDQASQEQEPNNLKQDRERFGVMLRKWKEQLMRAVDSFNEEADRDRDRLEKKQRDLAIKEARRKAEEERLALAARQEGAWQSSLQQIVSKPRPMAEKWLKATQHWSLLPPPPSSSGGGTNDGRDARRFSNPSVASQPQATRPSSSSSSSVALRPPSSSAPAATAVVAREPPGRALPPLVLDYTPWPVDETEWFLMELQRPDRRHGYLEVCAETLDHPLWEVRKEKERLKRLGRYQSPGV